MPGGLICPHCRRYTSADDKRCNHCGKYVGGAAFASALRAVGGTEHVATKFLLGLCVIMYGVEMALSVKLGDLSMFTPSAQALVVLGANMGYAQPWRVASAVLLHGNLLHIGMNGLGMISLGRGTEQRFGAARTITLFFATGIIGFALSLWVHGGLTFSVGASGGLFGFVGADLAIVLSQRAAGGRQLVIKSLVYAVLWSLLPMIDFWAHMGGLASGFALGWLFSREWRAQRHAWIFQIAAVVLTASAVGAIVLSAVSTPLVTSETDDSEDGGS